ncbi:GNAT family N-acetyltransferase [Occultella gossypii]|uniref:GNAT family N-acetyltransferase n=1 Tax=Occultella gossypii TaxID=2800820 RepID=A0ABS7SF94_9MICO|nr:GNAT family N-acetyltransferase [Occultella gossypii]MBZ2198815.1 GNAT family N-acetyltransferase [Occultella gossypii]
MARTVEAVTDLRIVPANEATWADLAAIFGTRGEGSRCMCQRYKLSRGEAFANFPVAERAARLREQTECENPGSDTTSGLVGYDGGEPVGWCAVEPRPHYDGLVRVGRVPWTGRAEDRTDAGIWAVTCVFTRAGHRRRGISHALVRAAVDHARERGARALEGYPTRTAGTIEQDLHVGTIAAFAAAGFTAIGEPSPRRVVMRIDF